MSARGQIVDQAEQLKAEAERLLNVDCQRSLELADRICTLQPDGSVQALGLLARGDALRELGRHDQAMQAYDAAADLYLALGDDVGWARTRIGATLTCRYTGAHTKVLGELGAARDILTNHRLWIRLARLETFSGGLLAALGRVEDGLAAHQRALEAVARIVPSNDLLEAEVLGNLSLAHYQVDDFEQAEAFHRRAVAIFERDGQREHVARAHRNYARFAAGRGHYSKALAAVMPGRRALRLIGRTEGAAHLGQVGVDCLIRLNRPAEAVALAAEVAAEFESIGAAVEAGTTYVLRALALARQGDATSALADLATAGALFGACNWDSGLAAVRLGRAVVLGESGEWAPALAEACAVRADLHRHGSISRAVEADLVRARALRALGQSEPAAEAARAALDLLQGHVQPLPWLTYHAWRLLGELARDACQDSVALDAFRQAIGNLEHAQGRILTEYRASFLVDKVDVYEAAVDLLVGAGNAEAAFDLVERAKSRALVDALAGGLDIRVRADTPAQQDLVDDLGRLRRQHDRLVDGGADSADLPRLERQIGATLEELRLASVDDLERLSLLEGRVYSPQALLDPATALIEFYSIADDLVVFVLNGTQLHQRRLPHALPLVDRLFRVLQLNLAAAALAPDRRTALEGQARAILGRLYDVLIRPVCDLLAAYQRLVVVPHGVLHQVPFAALHDGQAYLVERFEVVEAPSASSLTFCLRDRKRSGLRALVVGHSAGGALPGAIDEAQAVGVLLGAETLIESNATPSRLRDLAPEADLIHLAAHGVSRPDAPLFSYLRLAGGHLTALDCFELELDCALVTLSACESGPAQLAAGDEPVGLPRAFLYPGARAVLHTLWRIDDRATQALMQRFYAELATGQSRGAALRAAQLDSLQSAAGHPFFWAGFVLVGDWR